MKLVVKHNLHIMRSKMMLAKEVEHAGKKVNVYFDPEPFNPREWDNATMMVHWHRRYDLGDKRIELTTKEELIAECEEAGDPILAILPLNLYDHSGLSVSTDSFSCNFDSGQVGWVFVTESKKSEMGFGEMTTEQWDEVINCDVKTYDDYLTGQVYGYEVVGKGGDFLESCWGYVGDMSYCLTEGKKVAESVVDPAVFGDNSEEHY